MKKKSKIVIGVHGLGNKPPKEKLENWWKQAIIDGLRFNGYSIANFDFELVYWADILHPDPVDVNADITSKQPFTEIYSSIDYSNQNENLSYAARAKEYLEKYYGKFIVNEVLSLKYPTLTELFIYLHLRDLKTYFELQTVPCDGKNVPAKEVIIDRFIDCMNKHKDKKIMLIAHSMGTIIVQDALIEHLPEIDIDTYVTIGSPLGQRYVLNKYEIEHTQTLKNKLVVPDQIISRWHNLSDPDDQVALNHELTNLYAANSRNVKIEDQIVKNLFKSEGVKNPHKSYGYLRTPEFSKVINSFLVQKPAGLFEWIKKIFS
jgi:hypothetical protein